MLTAPTIVIIAFLYLCLLFAIAYYGDKRADAGGASSQPVHLRAVARRLLHRLDLLRQRRPRRLERRRVPADLPRPDADFHSGVVR